MKNTVKNNSLNENIKINKLDTIYNLTEVLQNAYELLGNPVMILDLCYNVIDYTKITPTDDPLWSELESVGHFSHETVDFFNSVNFIEEVASNDIVTLLKSKELKYNRFCGKYFNDNDEVIGSISIVECEKNFTNEDYKNVEIVCENITNELRKNNFLLINKNTSFDNAIRNLIEEKELSLKDNDVISSFNLQFKPYSYVAIIDIMKYNISLTHLPYFRDLFNKNYNNMKCSIYENNIVAIFNYENEISANSGYSSFCDFMLKDNLYVGISSQFNNMYNLKKYYIQAINALNYGITLNENKKIYMFDDYKLDYFLNSNKNNSLEIDFYPDVIKKIIEYDEKFKTNYLNFIYYYLLYCENIKQTCIYLNINEDEFELKLNEFNILFDFKWKDGNFIFNVFLALKIYKLNL